MKILSVPIILFTHLDWMISSNSSSLCLCLSLIIYSSSTNYMLDIAITRILPCRIRICSRITPNKIAWPVSDAIPTNRPSFSTIPLLEQGSQVPSQALFDSLIIHPIMKSGQFWRQIRDSQMLNHTVAFSEVCWNVFGRSIFIFIVLLRCNKIRECPFSKNVTMAAMTAAINKLTTITNSNCADNGITPSKHA